MKALPAVEQTCENCVHERSKGPEYCPCCIGDPPSAFREDPWHLEQRADAIIGELRGQMAAMRKLLISECEICNERDEYGSCSHERPGGCGFHDTLTFEAGKPEADVIAAATARVTALKSWQALIKKYREDDGTLLLPGDALCARNEAESVAHEQYLEADRTAILAVERMSERRP